MLGNFDEDARKVLMLAKKEMRELNHPYVSSEHLLLAILKGENDVSGRLEEYDLTYDIFKKEIIKIIGKGTKPSEYFLYTPLLKRILETAGIDAKENNNGIVTIGHLFCGLLEEGEGVAIRVLIGMDIDVDELYNDFACNLVVKKNSKKLLIEELGVDLNKKALEGKLDPVTGRDREIKRVLEILCRRTKNNPLLLGEPGVGKTAIVEELANMIVRGDVPMSLKNKRIISLDMATSVAGTKYRGEFEERMHRILKEIEDNDDIILFIDEVHTLVGAGGAEGAIDASNIFKPALARGNLRCIGATTTLEYKQFIEKDGALERRFQKVMVEEASTETVKDILMNLKDIYESYHKVIISEEIIDLIINLSHKYIYNRREPDKSIDILDEVCAKASLKESKNLVKYNNYNKRLKEIISKKKKAIINSNFELATEFKNMEYKLMNEINNLELNLYKRSRCKVTKRDVADVIHNRTNIPVYELLNEKKSILKHTESILKQNIVGQNVAIKSVSNIAKKIKLGFNDRCYSMLFCGPSGVGKTKLALNFGKNLVGEDNVIKLDMSEYSEAHSISKIIGAPPGYVGYDDSYSILDQIKNKPYSVLILDEVEKAHSDIISLFLQILDEGKIKDNRSNIIRFDNVVIILTSNVGFNDINVGFRNENKLSNKLNDRFSIPFMNRVDNVIEFNNLKEDSIIKIINSKISDLKNKYKNKISIRIGKQVISEIVKMSNYEQYGARKIGKIIKDTLETEVVEALINNRDSIFIRELGQMV